MRIAGIYVGLGLGDSSEEVRKIKAFMRRKFSYAAQLADTSLYDQEMVDAVVSMQRRYVAAGRLSTEAHIPGVVNLETKIVMGYLPRPVKPKPVLFTIEGHMSNMWFGPCAETGRILEAEGVCRWQPVGYDTVSLPFNNASGINEFCRLLGDTTLLPPGTPWGAAIYSQGGIVGSEAFLRHIFNPNGKLHWRLRDWRATLAFGNPYREKDRAAEWLLDPPFPGTRGLSNVRLTNTPDNWKEVSRHGDLYAENEESDAGEWKTSVYMVIQNQWSGDPDSIFSQFTELAERPLTEFIAIFQAIISGVLFAGNMDPHGGFDLRPCIDYMRGRLKG